MKKLFVTLFLALGIAATSYAQGENMKIKKGQPAPELAFENPEGKTMKLSDINKGQIVLIDFWASWCRPCRMANPRLVDMYNKYKDMKYKGAKKGFTVLSVSLDKNKEAWVAAIAKDNLAWNNHISDLNGWESKAAGDYGIQYIPQAFLVDADGKVVGLYANAEQAEEDLKKLLK